MDGPDLLLSENCFLSGGFILKIDIDWICEYKLALSPNSAILGKYAGNILSILEFYHDLLGISEDLLPKVATDSADDSSKSQVSSELGVGNLL
ncbi:hypothetical protein [Halorussus caseinilyticus]|uniref:Uncharacterized protein n=1 Tax=Halorussus caseinilyticus TaxID=3034025 RepID=A0ABD5WQS9_9EURY